MAQDGRFEFPVEPAMGLVCFRLKGKDNGASETLLKRITEAGKVYMIPAQLGDAYIIRMAVCSRYTTETDVEASWAEIKRHTDDLFDS